MNMKLISAVHTEVVWLLSRIGCFFRDYEYKSCPESSMVMIFKPLGNDSLQKKFVKNLKFSNFDQ